ncbi:hypothetical protein [Conexibacter woesei]|uniref:hypothetical protein n=1 Tax=Conexibacter woesei TaxID=191495 RepID=UPI00041B8A4F|nr:hypothetical protein [Conexibacter woesei]
MTPPPAATAGGTRALPRTAVPRAPRRVSGPAKPNRRDGGGASAGAIRDRRDDSARRARTRGATAGDPFVVRALHRTQRMADSRFLDRLIRGRLWIPLVAVGLMGIVFMQVTMLKFNAGIGRAVTSAATLEQQNATMRADLSRQESGDRIATVAHSLGMVVPADGTTAYVAAARGQAHKAVTKMTPADASAVQRTQAGAQLAQGQAAGTQTTGSATAAPTPAQAQVQAATGTQQPVTPVTPSTSTSTGASATGTTGTTAQTPSTAVAQAPAGGTATTASTGTGTGTTAAGTTSGGTAAAGTTAAAAGTAPQQQPQTTGATAAPQG